jgi:hypothetical protein
MALLAPLFLAVPAVTLGNLFLEHAFVRKWSRRLAKAGAVRLQPSGAWEF